MNTKLVLVNVAIVLTAFFGQLSAASESASGITLTVWQTETDTDAVKVLNGIGQQFEATHAGVRVFIEAVPWDSLSARLNVAVKNKSLPDITHLEPFMAYSIYKKDGLLLPLDDLMRNIEADNHDTIMAAVRDLQLYNGRHYGLAYAVGTTAWAYRRDLALLAKSNPPKKLSGYISFVRSLKEANGGTAQGVTLPGGSPFFIDQLFAELVANDGGTLFNPHTMMPTLDSPTVIEVLAFFKELGQSGLLDPSWTTTSYTDQFNLLARSEVLCVPVTYARAGRAIQKVLLGNPTSGPTPDDRTFAWMEQPTGSHYNGPPRATIDCEPYVVFSSALDRKAGKYGNNAQLAMEFLRLFYNRDNYLRFVSTVPIHLTPIFVGMSRSAAYRDLDYIKHWQSWADHTDRFLAAADGTRPILMPDISEEGRAIPYLLDLQARRVLYNAVVGVINQPSLSPEEAAKRAQQRALALKVELDEAGAGKSN